MADFASGYDLIDELKRMEEDALNAYSTGRYRDYQTKRKNVDALRAEHAGNISAIDRAARNPIFKQIHGDLTGDLSDSSLDMKIQRGIALGAFKPMTVMGRDEMLALDMDQVRSEYSKMTAQERRNFTDVMDQEEAIDSRRHAIKYGTTSLAVLDDTIKDFERFNGISDGIHKMSAADDKIGYIKKYAATVDGRTELDLADAPMEDFRIRNSAGGKGFTVPTLTKLYQGIMSGDTDVMIQMKEKYAELSPADKIKFKQTALAKKLASLAPDVFVKEGAEVNTTTGEISGAVVAPDIGQRVAETAIRAGRNFIGLGNIGGAGAEYLHNKDPQGRKDIETRIAKNIDDIGFERIGAAVYDTQGVEAETAILTRVLVAASDELGKKPVSRWTKSERNRFLNMVATSKKSFISYLGEGQGTSTFNNMLSDLNYRVSKELFNIAAGAESARAAKEAEKGASKQTKTSLTSTSGLDNLPLTAAQGSK